MLYNLKFLRDLRTFGGQEGSKGGAEKDSGSKSTADSTSFKATPKPTIGAVSSSGQYAGDGFEWVSQGTNENGSQMLTRTYTGANSGAGLGQAVISGGTSDKDVKTAIGQISLNEGSSYASTPSSATDGDALQYLKTAFAPDTPASSGRSGSFAEQMGNVNYAQTTPGSSGSFNDAFAAARQDQGAGGVFNYDGNQFTTDYAPKSTGIMSSLRPQQRPVVASEPIVSADYGGESSGDFLSRRSRDRDLNPGDTNIGDGVQVAGGSFLDYILGRNDDQPEPVVSYDAFGNAYATAEEAAEADLRAEFASRGANAVVNNSLLKELNPYVVSAGVGLGEGLGAFLQGAGQTYDEIVNAGPTNLNLQKMESIPKSMQTEAMITAAAEEGLRNYVDPSLVKSETGFETMSFLTDASQNLDKLAAKNVEGYVSDQEVFPGLKRYDDVVGYTEGRVDPSLLAAQQAQNPSSFLLGFVSFFTLSINISVCLLLVKTKGIMAALLGTILRMLFQLIVISPTLLVILYGQVSKY